MLNLLSILVVKYMSIICVFHKKIVSNKIETLAKTDFLSKKSMYLVFI